MKKNLINLITVGLISICIYSFKTSVNTAKKAVVKASATYTCNAGVSGLHVVSYQYGTVTIAWQGVNNPTYYTYGGYYMCATTQTFGSSTTATQVTIPLGPGDCGGTINVTGWCASGPGSGSNTTF